MPRYFLKIEYDGTPFVGWQRQENGLSVQEAIEEAGRGFTGALTPAYAAGRTDAGVHALGMVAHIDLPNHYDPSTVVGALNAHLRPHPIGILSAQPVPDDRHARFSCHGRHYLYRLLSQRSPSPLRAQRVWQLPQALNLQEMQRAAHHFEGRHDFSAFRSAQCQAKTPIKTLSVVTVERNLDELHCKLSAPSFLHNQVRSIVGTLVQVGLGRWCADEICDILNSKDRARCGPVAPAYGLYFEKADYGEDTP